MKEIIAGKRYDTDTAKLLGNSEHGLPGDLNYISESLYRKGTGEFFLMGEGGAASRYARRVGERWAQGENIIPISFGEAQEWAERNLTADEYEQIFGAVEETAGKRTVTFSLPENIIEMIARIAAEKGINKSEVVEAAVRNL